MIVFVVPSFNALKNIDALVSSIYSQTDKDWRIIYIDDVSDDEFKFDDSINVFELLDEKIDVIINVEKKYALRNIVDNVKRLCDDDDIVAVVDGDDQLCNINTVSLLKDAYLDPDVDVVWTAHKWDTNGINVSKDMPQGINPYQWEWCSSHLKTFRAKLLRNIPESNFKDMNGKWFQRGYDQALMLPLLYKSKKRKYIPDVCYQYNINSCSINDRDWSERRQLNTVNLVRARGYLKE